MLDAVLATGCPQLDDRVLWLDGKPHRAPTPEPGTGTIAPRRTVLDPILLAAAEQAGARVEIGYCARPATRRRACYRSQDVGGRTARAAGDRRGRPQLPDSPAGRGTDLP